jgi:hypothetical protein
MAYAEIRTCEWSDHLCYGMFRGCWVYHDIFSLSSPTFKSGKDGKIRNMRPPHFLIMQGDIEIEIQNYVALFFLLAEVLKICRTLIIPHHLPTIVMICDIQCVWKRTPRVLVIQIYSLLNHGIGTFQKIQCKISPSVSNMNIRDGITAPRQAGTAWKWDSRYHGAAAGEGRMHVVLHGIKVCVHCPEKLQVVLSKRLSYWFEYL